LLGQDDADAGGALLDLAAAQAALQTITGQCKTTAVVDVGTARFKPDLAAAFGLTGPDPLPPAAQRTQTNRLT
jgi:hypothetical protein